MNRIIQLKAISSVFLSCAFLLGCGGSDNKRATLPSNVTLQESLKISGVKAAITDVPISAGSPKCGVDIYHYTYDTIGGKGEAATASAALFVPTGVVASCSGSRPLLIHLHGTETSKSLNLANLSEEEAQYSVAFFAAQGYITIMPNYAGYDSSNLPYHPYQNADQQSQDVIDAITAGRKVLAAVSTSTKENGRLFLTGYSQGGYVAMATHRAMQARGMTVTASANASGSYAFISIVDTVFKGQPSDGAEVYLPMIISSYQNSYGDIYDTTSDIYTAKFAGYIETLLPSELSFEELDDSGTLPQFLFGTDAPNYASVTPAYASLYGPPETSLINSSYLADYLDDVAANPCSISLAQPLACTPKNKLRAALVKNDLRNWVPRSPMLLCGGHEDSQVYFSSSEQTKAYFDAQGAQTVSLLDVDSPITLNDPYEAEKTIFMEFKFALFNSAVEAGENPDEFLRQYSHYLPVEACTLAARNFFDSFQ